MSAVRAVLMTCDECGEEELFPDCESKVKARSDAKISKWTTGLKATVDRPSMYDIKVDLCRWCKP